MMRFKITYTTTEGKAAPIYRECRATTNAGIKRFMKRQLDAWMRVEGVLGCVIERVEDCA